MKLCLREKGFFCEFSLHICNWKRAKIASNDEEINIAFLDVVSLFLIIIKLSARLLYK